ncbi:MAG TPA: class I SAM-dependent methyltransferase [Kofleriaceae bacterium]|nr:class I SAM-dependent methyltransferase [Kofleriaceae bacterium]
MSFEVAGEKYDRFMGRYSRALAPAFIAFARPSGPVLDIGCGPGPLTSELAKTFEVSAVDPSQAFVAACRARVPNADVRVAPGETLPFADGSFGASMSQLVLSFVRDPDTFAAESRRVVRPGGVVAACMWEADGLGLVTPFWAAARALDANAPDESRMRFRTAGELEELWRGAGVRDVEVATIECSSEYAGFDDYWEPFTYGIGPAGTYLMALPEEVREALREETRDRLPKGPLTIVARAVAVRGHA